MSRDDIKRNTADSIENGTYIAATTVEGKDRPVSDFATVKYRVVSTSQESGAVHVRMIPRGNPKDKSETG